MKQFTSFDVIVRTTYLELATTKKAVEVPECFFSLAINGQNKAMLGITNAISDDNKMMNTVNNSTLNSSVGFTRVTCDCSPIHVGVHTQLFPYHYMTSKLATDDKNKISNTFTSTSTSNNSTIDCVGVTLSEYQQLWNSLSCSHVIEGYITTPNGILSLENSSIIREVSKSQFHQIKQRQLSDLVTKSILQLTMGSPSCSYPYMSHFQSINKGLNVVGIDCRVIPDISPVLMNHTNHTNHPIFSTQNSNEMSNDKISHSFDVISNKGGISTHDNGIKLPWVSGIVPGELGWAMVTQGGIPVAVRVVLREGNNRDRKNKFLLICSSNYYGGRVENDDDDDDGDDVYNGDQTDGSEEEDDDEDEVIVDVEIRSANDEIISGILDDADEFLIALSGGVIRC